MSDEPLQVRPRTATRLKGEAPPGMQLSGEEGRQRIGRYEVIKTIGKGAMGIVYKARDPLLDRIVAVKTIMSPQGQGRRVRSAFLERFQREAKAAAKMQHPAIVTIFDVGVDEQSGAPFMVLEYLPGESLADRLDRVRFPLQRCVQIALDLSSALAFAHRQRIVHRDVKPANVLHAGDNRWKLADFGIARLPDSDLTQVGIFMGTPGYSPPEAIREGRYTPQADVFAWGACLYELLSGRIPYEGPDTKTTNSYVVSGNALPPTRHDPSIPEPLATVVMTALQPSDRTRYKDSSDAEQALREAWNRCLTQGLVHPSVLVMEEVPHDKASARMHEPKGGPRPQNVVLNDSQEITAIDTKTMGLVIESKAVGTRDADDDPTMLHVRDDLKPKPDATVRGVGGQAVEVRNDDSVRDTKAEPPRFGASISERSKGTRVMWIAIVAILALAGTIAALYFLGFIE
ncbi:MAG: serine/threonine protein kinase [Deltaproteobacteria bacterium]|nr:serine/threonine protein kinase [Deltaproteobacteria bacterium]MDQ3300968.1 serine/threonine protein kinase [Myxococcota bacterium]